MLIRGESGTGKELFARLVHEQSGRRGAFVAVNCAALPEAILESALFGHRRGASTGAAESSPGLIVAADGGTVFLDEVGELPAAVQSKLLRVLQERRVLTVGDSRERAVDLRVVPASHKGLRELVARGAFREDLFFRLSRFELDLPALRERGRDVVPIARSLLSRGVEGLPARALSRSSEPVLLAHAWPGNVRELEKVLFRVALAARSPTVTGHDLCLTLGLDAAPAPAVPLAARVLYLAGGADGVRSSELAASLGVPRSTPKRLLKALVEAGDLVARGVLVPDGRKGNAGGYVRGLRLAA